ncbi:hypothetical protein [uncultured Jatrophihabitans sp.]|uniref:hypothetical protein n=1 Tax=uncultured Jatrophihabitans sp. TaxID=1610747 RepID=UPI0035CC52EB
MSTPDVCVFKVAGVHAAAAVLVVDTAGDEPAPAGADGLDEVDEVDEPGEPPSLEDAHAARPSVATPASRAAANTT